MAEYDPLVPGTTPDPARWLAERVTRTRLEDIPTAVVTHALLVIADTLAILVHAAHTHTTASRLAEAMSATPSGAASIVGTDLGASAAVAALINTTSGLSLELDEGNQYATNHPAIHVLPAVLATAEARAHDGRSLLASFIMGYEVAARFGRATRLRDATHPFGTTNTVACAAAVASLRGQGADEVLESMRVAAGTTIASSQRAANEGASVRNLAAGLTVHNGVLAPDLVSAGIHGEHDPWSAVYGTLLGDRFDPTVLAADPDTWYLPRNYMKLHACSRWNHAPIEAVARLQQDGPLDPADIAQIRVETYAPATRLADRAPRNGFAAKHSIPFNVAARIIWGSNGLEVFTDAHAEDPVLRALAAKVEVREDPVLTRLLPHARPARVTVELQGGTERSARVDRPPGGFDAPYTAAILYEKRRDLVSPVLGEAGFQELERLVRSLPEVPDVGGFTQLLRR